MATFIVSSSKQSLKISEELTIYYDTSYGNIKKFFREDFGKTFLTPKMMRLGHSNKCIIITNVSESSNDLEQCSILLTELAELEDFRKNFEIVYWITCFDGYATEFNLGKYLPLIDRLDKIELGNTLFRKILLSQQLMTGAYLKDGDFQKQINEIINFLAKQSSNTLDNLAINENNVVYSLGLSKLISPKKRVKNMLHFYSYAKNLYAILKPSNIDSFTPFFQHFIDHTNKISFKNVLEQDFKESQPHRESVELTLKTFWEENLETIDDRIKCIEKRFSDFWNQKSGSFTDQLIENRESVIRNPLSIKKSTSKLLKTKLEQLAKHYNSFKAQILQSENEIRLQKEQVKEETFSAFDQLTLTLISDSHSLNFGNISRTNIVYHILSVFENKDNQHANIFTQGFQYNIDKLKLIHCQDSNEERLEERLKTVKQFHSEKKQTEDEILSNCEILEEENGLLEQLNNANEDLHLGVINKDRPIHKGKFSKLTYRVFYTILSLIILNVLSFAFASNWSFHLFSTIVPLFIGGVSIWAIYQSVRSLRKRIEKVFLYISNEFAHLIQVHDNYAKTYLKQVKKDYTVKLISQIEKNIELRKLQISAFREYLLKHIVGAIQDYKQIINEQTDFVSYYPNFQELSQNILEEDKGDYFIKKTEKQVELLNNFLEKLHVEPETSNDITPSFNMLMENIENHEIVQPKQQDINQVEYRKIEEYQPVLFQSSGNNEDDVSYTDIKQGTAGTCYFLASLGAFAINHKGFLSSMVLQIESNTQKEINANSKSPSYMVRFFDNEGQIAYVAVDSKFWYFNNSKTPAYANYGDIVDKKAEIWPMIIEKAWAKANGSYENINGGSMIGQDNRKYPDYCLALTGTPMKTYFFRNTVKQEIVSTLNEYLNIKKYPLTCASKEFNNIDNENRNKEGVVSNHMYYIARFDVENEEIDIINPHGKNHLKNKNIDFLLEHFDGICILTATIHDRNFDPKFHFKSVEKLKIAEDFISNAIKERVDGISKIIPEIVPENQEEMKQIINELELVSSPMFIFPNNEELEPLKKVWGNKEYQDKTSSNDSINEMDDENEVGIVQVIRYKYEAN